ncbi:polysaccharide deacetylase family protein, partial [Klebsiella pneumoniae]
ISCSVHRFRQFCRFFRAYFDVVPLSEILRRLREGVALDGALAITLDDGYRGNFTVVAPTLREFGLPASFFIATDFIGTDAAPYW